MAFEHTQQLPREMYFDDAWFKREQRELFDQSWVFAGTTSELANPGDFVTARFMDHALFVVRDREDRLRAFHNICRHRCSEVLEGRGNTGNSIVCPYHRWTYSLDGTLRGVTNEDPLFPGLDRGSLGLHPASVGEYRGLVFVNPCPTPLDSFRDWIATLGEHAWPHRFDDGSMTYSGQVVYEMRCNWKVFYENAIDGYHLGYLHDQTLGKVYPDRNVWDQVGRNHVWYSTERDGRRTASTVLSAELADGFGAQRLHTDDEASYPGVIMLFPLTILSPSPWGFYVSVLEPKGSELTLMRTLSWSPVGSGGPADIGAEAPRPIRLIDLDQHPLESGNFQLEDMWIVEKVQRNLRSPRYQVGPLASGDGAETPIVQFQQQVLEFVQPAG